MHAKGPDLSHTMCLRDGDRGTAGSSLPAPHPPILASPSSSSPYPAWPLHVYEPLATERGQRLAHSRFEPGAGRWRLNVPPGRWGCRTFLHRSGQLSSFLSQRDAGAELLGLELGLEEAAGPCRAALPAAASPGGLRLPQGRDRELSVGPSVGTE